MEIFSFILYPERYQENDTRYRRYPEHNKEINFHFIFNAPFCLAE